MYAAKRADISGGLDADVIVVIEAYLAGKSAVGAASGDEEGGEDN